MKTKITSFLTAAVFSVLALANSSFAETESGFYDKDHIRGFVSFGADFRSMHSDFNTYINNLTRYGIKDGEGTHTATVTTEDGEQTVTFTSDKNLKYASFDDYYFGLHFIFGAQYKQFQTWIDLNFMPTQISEASKSSYTASSSAGEKDFPLYDIKWYTYGADWMFGWKIFGENNFFNLIPAAGFGFNLLNVHFASDFDVNGVTLRNRYYSTMATTVNGELEGRLEFDHLALGLYVGYRFVRYNEMNIEGEEVATTKLSGNDGTDNNGDTFFLGLRLTWIFHSDWQTKQDSKL